MSRICIAIDGPASSGKGTVARSLAQKLGYAYIDTGAMYRTVALLAQEAGVDWSDGLGLGQLASRIAFRFRWEGGELSIYADGRDVSQQIRGEAVGQGASAVAVKPEVRSALLDLQRGLAVGGGVVMDGRDIGTVVLPAAELKIYLDASAEERARRRSLEMERRGLPADQARILAEIQHRDHQDSSRAVAPLKKADDAWYVDSSALRAEEVVALLVARVREMTGETAA